MNNTFDLICFSAPSGTGKSTVIDLLLNTDSSLALSISATTRNPRGSEKDGVEYIFLSDTEFKKKINNSELLEFEEVHGYYYGTLIETVDSFLANGKKVVFDIDVNGALQIKKKYAEKALLIFLKPPNIEELKRRLKNRKTESQDKINKRLERLPYEMEKSVEFDRVVINDKLEETVIKIKNIISGGLNDSKDD